MRNIYLIFCVYLFFSCEQKANNSIVNNEDNNPTKVDSGEKTIDSDSTIVVYAKKYFDAIERRSSVEMVDLLYPGVETYLKKEFPEEYRNSTMTTIANEMLAMIDDSEKQLKSQLTFKIGDIKNRVSYESSMIYTIETFLEFKKDIDSHSLGEEILGISMDHGHTWTFVNKDPNSFKQILRTDFPLQVVEKVK